MKFYDYKGARIAVRQTGEGPPIIFVHCSSASHKEWLFAAQHYSSTHICLLPDMIGYGQSSGHLDEHGVPIACSDADVIAMLLRQQSEPADIVAHSYGAVACIEAARMVPEKVKSMFLVEPVTFHLLRSEEHRDIWKQLGRLAQTVIDADAKGDYRKAARAYMSYWIGHLKWMFSPRRFKKAIIQTVPKVAHEFRQVFLQDSDASVYRVIDCPITILTGGKSTKAAHRTTEVLSSQFRHCRTVSIPSAGHMMPFTHPAQTFELLNQHLLDAARDRIDPASDATGSAAT